MKNNIFVKNSQGKYRFLDFVNINFMYTYMFSVKRKLRKVSYFPQFAIVFATNQQSKIMKKNDQRIKFCTTQMKNIGLHEQLSITLDLVCFSQHAIADNNIQFWMAM